MKKFLFMILFVFFLFPAVSLFAVQTPEEDVSKARLLLGPNRWIQLHYFLQTGYQSADTIDENNDKYWSNDFYVKRSRVILNGQVSSSVYFFFQSEDLKAGASNSDESEENNSTGENKMFTQDAYLHFKPSDGFQIYAGLLALPFNRQSCQSAATSLGIDLNNAVLPFNNYSNNNRDTGFMLRGLLGSKIFEYRLGVFRGLDRKIRTEEVANGDPVLTDDVRNEKDYPRVTGRIQLHGMDPEEGFFYSGNYLGKKNVLGLGIGVDYQQDVFTKNGSDYKDHLALSVDISMDFVLAGGNSVASQFGFMKSDYNPAEGLDENGVLLYNKMYAYYGQIGMYVMHSLQPLIKYTYRKNRDADNGANVVNKTLGFGLNYFILENHANVKFNFDYPLGDNEDVSAEKKGTMQLQVYM